MMTEKNFDLKLLDLHWIETIDEATDLCAHGHVFVKIGNEIIADANSLDVTVSSTALYLMRSLKSDYKKDDYASQLLPCCGYFFVANEGGDFVNICGCGNGIDWTIIHCDDDKIKHVSENGLEIEIEKQIYKRIVLEFADQVERFYIDSVPKIIPTDDFDKNGYLTFWREWRRLRDEYK